jgi:hypothetical protein
MRSLEQIKSDLVASILALRRNIRLVSGDVSYDIVVDAPAQQFYKYDILLEFEDRCRNLQGFTNLISDTDFQTTVANALGKKQDGSNYTVADVGDMISERLDKYVEGFGITRNTGVKALGSVRMYTYDATPISWSMSTEFTSKNFSYLSTTSITNLRPILDNKTGLYFVDIPIQAASVGESGNATIGSVNGLATKPSSFSYCSNIVPITGGSSEENDLNLISRCQEVNTKRVGGSQAYLVGLSEEQSFVDDVVAITQDDPAQGIFVGSVCDIFSQFAGEDLQVVEENIYWPGEIENDNSETFTFTPQNQPLSENFTPVLFRYATGSSTEEQIVADGTLTIVEVIKDTGTFSGSTKAMDKIRVKLAHNCGSLAATYKRVIKLLYAYDKNPYRLQNVLALDTERLVGPSPLVRNAIQVPVKITCTPTIAFGYDTVTVQDAITSNLEIFFNGGTTSYGRAFARKGIGDDISHSDISNIILRTEGVVSFDFDTFYVLNTLTGDRNDPTIVRSNEYAVLESISFTYETFNANV